MQRETRIELAISLVTLLILGTTLWIGKKQAESTTEHNATSVRPYLDFSLDLNPQDPWTAVHLVNDGPGPARIVWAEVRVDGQRPVDPKLNGWEEFRSRIGKDLTENNVDFLSPGETIAPRERKTLIRLRIPDKFQELEARTKFRDRNVSILRRIQFTSCYCSLYDDCWTVTVRLPGDRQTEKTCYESPAAVPTVKSARAISSGEAVEGSQPPPAAERLPPQTPTD